MHLSGLAPVSGRVLEAKVIPGLCYLEVVVKEADLKSPDGRPRLGMHRQIIPKKDDPRVISHSEAIRRNQQRSQDAPTDLVPDAPDSPGYQFIQARGLILIESEIGLVAVLPIGMAQVSSVVLADNIKPGNWVNKGDEISKFQLGGSDIVMVFQKDAKVQLPGKEKINQKFNVRSHFGKGTIVKKVTPSN